MNYKTCMKTLGIALLTTGWLASTELLAATANSDGYTVEDLTLNSSQNLVDVCSLETGHQHYDVAIGFCYGFFEGVTHYDDAISDTGWHEDIVCSPDGVTREQAVAVFIDYMAANPQYGEEAPIDSIFRSLIAKWPCAE